MRISIIKKYINKALDISEQPTSLDTKEFELIKLFYDYTNAVYDSVCKTLRLYRE